jgi:phosphoglucomutase
VSRHQGLRLLLADGSRLICRLSGTGTTGATLRLYLEHYRDDAGRADLDSILAPLAQAALQLLELPKRCGREAPTVIT